MRFNDVISDYEANNIQKYGENDKEATILFVDKKGDLSFSLEDFGDKKYENLSVVIISPDVTGLSTPSPFSFDAMHKSPFRKAAAIVCSDELRQSKLMESNQFFTKAVRNSTFDGAVLTYDEFEEFIKNIENTRNRLVEKKINYDEHIESRLPMFFLNDKYSTDNFRMEYDLAGLTLHSSICKNPTDITILEMPERIDNIGCNFTNGFSNLETIIFSERTNFVSSIDWSNIEQKIVDDLAESINSSSADLIVCTDSLRKQIEGVLTREVFFMSHENYAEFQKVCENEGTRDVAGWAMIYDYQRENRDALTIESKKQDIEIG